MFDQKPTIESIKAHTEHLKEVWRDTHNNWRTYDTFYERKFKLWDKRLNRPTVHPAKSRAIIDTAVSQLMGHEPTFERFPHDASEQEQADSGEKALKAMFEQMALLEAELTPETAKKHLMIYGYAIVEDSIDGNDLVEHQKPKPEQEEGEGEVAYDRRIRLWEHKKKTLMPFRNKAPHPSDILMDPNNKESSIAIKIGKWFVGELVDITQSRMDEDGKPLKGEVAKFEPRENPFELVEAIEYWTTTWHALLVTGGSSLLNRVLSKFTGGGDQMLILEPNTWGFVPFEQAFAGFGHQPTDINSRNTRFLAVGMYEAIMDDLVMDAQRTAGMHNALMDATFATMGTTEDPSELENQLSEGDTVQLPNKGATWFLEQPQLPGHLQNFGIENNKDIEDATFPRGLGGIKDAGVDTVGQQAILNDAGHRRFIAPTQQVNQLFTKSAEHYLQWIDMLDLDLTIEGNRINREIIDGDYAVKVTFKVINPVLQMQERQQALTEYQAGVMDLQTFWSVAGRGDSSGARKRSWEDMVYAHPTIRDMFVRQVAQELGLETLLDENPDIVTESQDTTPQSKILGPDGQPLESTLGTGLRQPLDSRTLKPSQTGTNLAGQG